jgi:hypothetical protein
VAKKVDDPFNDDDWGLPDAQANGETDELPDPVTSEKPPFLKPFHAIKLAGRQGKCELTSVSRETTEYSDVVLYITLGKKPFRLGLRTFDPAYKALVQKFGKKPSEWHGALNFKVMPHKGKPDVFVSVRPA